MELNTALKRMDEAKKAIQDAGMFCVTILFDDDFLMDATDHRFTAKAIAEARAYINDFGEGFDGELHLGGSEMPINSASYVLEQFKTYVETKYAGTEEDTEREEWEVEA